MRISIFASSVIMATLALADAGGSYSVVLPSVEVEGISEQDSLKGYITYDSAELNRNGLSNKQTPQTIETIDIQKNRNYGTNDLSSILEGNAGVDAGYDMRGESIRIRGFSIDGGDIYRDGVRDSGQIRRSTANVERVEILKGPASILYGRSDGGAVVNLVSKKANFIPLQKISARYGSWYRMGMGADVNHVVNSKLAFRLTADGERGKSWRDDIKYKNFMISPSVIVTNEEGDISFEAQYTFDNAWRVPDRTPTKDIYDKLGLDYKKGFAHSGDFVEDRLHFFRTELNAELAKDMNLKWIFGYRQASQNFDHFYGGTIVGGNKIRQNYAKQQTDNNTISNTLTLTKELEFERIKHNIAFGYDHSLEKRAPKLWFSRSHTAVVDPYAPSSSWVSPRLEKLTTDNRHKAINHGVFFEDLISLDDKYRLLIGGRFDFYKFKTRDINGKTNSYDGNSFSPRVGLLWDFTDNHTAYVSYSQSFAPYGGRGNINISTNDISTLDTKPQNNVQYEIGLKSNWADNRFSSNLAVFQIEHKNIRYQPDATNDPYTWALRGKERSRGVELNVLGQIYGNLYLRSSLGYTDAKTTEDKSNKLYEGLNLNNTTKLQGNVFLRYVEDKKWYVESGVTGYSKRYNYTVSSSKVEQNHLPGFARVDLSAGYNFNENAQITLAINNLLDKKYWRSNARLGDERSFIMNFHYNF
ncbi:TonB-dependent siderophore receptor [Campylobacter sp. RM16188]|uniref:TonB-dependent receptor n=1 Tax=Campylobacter sp. RM16188 TaxID=1705725 RepID=UPI00155249DF|nr:TonB-dependent receptor [Campylobacter sp. RM16188]